MRLFFKIFGYGLLLLLLAAGGFVALNWSMVTQIARYSPLVMPPFYSEPANAAEAREQDVRFLKRLINYDRSFSPEERAAFIVHVNDLEARASQLSKAELFLGAAEAAAISKNGHTGISASPLYREFNRIGLKLFWFSDGLYIVRAHENIANLVGARVFAIEGRDLDTVLEGLAKYNGGVAQWRRLYSSLYVESPEIMHAAGLASSPDALLISVVDADGNARNVTLTAEYSPSQMDLPRRRPWMTLIPTTLPDEDEEWRRTLSFEGAAPLYLRDTDENFFWLETNGGVYLRPHLLLERKETPIAENFEAILAAASDEPFDFMAVDLRWSPGGDYTRVIDFVKAAPDAIKDDGRLYIIVGPQTFSAALVTAAFLKHYGGDKAVIIGSPMGDDEQFWAETGFPFNLPNSKFRISYATGYHDWKNGCAGRHEYCFDQNLIHEVPAGSLAPLILLEPSYADYASRRDIVMDYVFTAEAKTSN